MTIIISLPPTVGQKSYPQLQYFCAGFWKKNMTQLHCNLFEVILFMFAQYTFRNISAKQKNVAKMLCHIVRRS